MIIGIGISVIGWLILFFVLLYSGMPSLDTGIIPPAWSMPPDLWLFGVTPFSGTIGWLILSFTLIVLGNLQIASVAGEYSVNEVWLSTFLNSGELKHFPVEISRTWIVGKLIFITAIIWWRKHDRIEAMEKNQHGTHVVISHHQAQVMRVGQFIWMTFIAFLFGLIDGSLTIPVLPCIAPSLFPDTTDIICSALDHISSTPIPTHVPIPTSIPTPTSIPSPISTSISSDNPVLSNIILATFITIFVCVMPMWMIVRAARRRPVQPELQDLSRTQTTSWHQNLGFFIICVIPAILLSLGNKESLIELVKFQLGVVLNFYIFAAFGKVQFEGILSLRYIRQHPELDNHQVLEAVAISSMKSALGGMLVVFVLVGILGGGIYGMGIALVGVIVGVAWTTVFINGDFHKSKIALWQLMAKHYTQHRS